ncbi:hypothetical protein DQ04_01141010 [Trypanosoma grayi]|uniref:hypothetical protein n=1 Tax=Trypanosoma grayi TaxID=71804 RepID=UPI0004F48716|nr:hypothetical protein DQ04_01141010 [Trypanosoma grayi]KEG13215.1 hypothetical protein DQ04_01141010 [Trypanosoma grayi]
MAAPTRERRECREPHTFFDSSYLEACTTPRLNNLTQHGRHDRNPDTTAASSAVFNRFSSVSPHQAGISYESTSTAGAGYFPPPPPPPPPPPFFVSGASLNPSFADWPAPPIPPATWAVPQDVPWIPPPPIPPNGTNAACGINDSNSNCATARWPTPQDIPLPSMFPFPPYLLPPFPPLPPNADMSQMPPPPPPSWFVLPPKQPQQQRVNEDVEDYGPSSTGDGSVEDAGPQRRPGQARCSTGRTRAPSISTQEEEHVRHIAHEARRELHRRLSRSPSRDSHQNFGGTWQRKPRNPTPRNGRAAPSPARRFSSPSTTRRTTGTPRGATSTAGILPNHRRRDYYTEARAVKGVSPCLEEVMSKRAYSPKVRVKSASRDEKSYSQARTGAGKRRNSTQLSYTSGVGDIHHALNREAAKKDEKVAEYLKGIEDLYQRLRNSYEEFQRDPSSFVKNASALKEAAVSKAPPLRSILDDTGIPIRKHGNDADERTVTKELLLPSEESQRIREELLRLEMQWQRLEELKQGSTGERGAAPVEYMPESVAVPPLPQRHGDGMTEPSGGGFASERAADMSTSRQETGLQRTPTVARSTNGKTVTMDSLSRSMTPPSASGQSKSRNLDGSQMNNHSRGGNSTGARGPFTREHVLGLVRERKALLE